MEDPTIVKKLVVEGYDIVVREGKEAYVITVPDLPGIIGQVTEIGQAKKEIRRLIGAHLRSLASKKAGIKNKKNL